MVVRGYLSERSKSLRAEKLKRRAERFIRGPLPLEWVMRAAALSRKSLHVALAIRFREGLEGRAIALKLCRSDMERFSVGRTAGFNALRELEAAGLIQVERKRGACPRVTILECKA